MSRTKKDCPGGSRRGRNSTTEYASDVLENGKPAGWMDHATPGQRRFLKKKVSKDRRRKSREIGFAEGETHLHTEDFAQLGLPTLDYRVYAAVTRALEESETPDELRKFLVDIAHKSDLLADTTYIQGLIALTEDNDSWIRSFETWSSDAEDRGEQFSKLARHLFADYEVPRFMDNAWLDGNPTHQHWFKHIGAGENIRTAPGLPFVLTKKMAHHFLEAPKDYTIEAALRWGQVHALGGNRRLVEALRETYLARTHNRHTPPCDSWFAEDGFWINVIRFFIAHPMFDVSHARSIIDYIRLQKYGDPQRNIAPAQPNFSMNGRTPESLLDQMEAWHRERRAEEAQRFRPETVHPPRRLREEDTPRHRRLRRQGRGEEIEEVKTGKSHQWEPSGIGGFHYKMKGIPWHIRELRSTTELRTEGSVMDHCVATYVDSCRNRRTSIWTMEIAGHDPRIHLSEGKALTIAVDLRSRSISEMRGRQNRLPTTKEKRILAKWAAREGLSILW